KNFTCGLHAAGLKVSRLIFVESNRQVKCCAEITVQQTLCQERCNCRQLLLRRRSRRTQQIYEQPICPGNPRGKLPEKRQPGVDVDSLAIMRPNQTSQRVGFPGIVHGQHCFVSRVPLPPEVQPALLNPALEIRLRDAVWIIEQRARWIEESHWRIFIRYTRRGSEKSAVRLVFSGRKRCRQQPVPRKIPFVLDQQRSA